MCFQNRQLDPKGRRLFVIGNLSLAVGLLLWNFVSLPGSVDRHWLHGLCGVLFGISISINLFGLRRRRCGEKQV